MEYSSLLKIIFLIFGSQWTYINCKSCSTSPGYFTLGIECFKLVTATPMTWLKARAHCLTEKADLAQPRHFTDLASHILANQLLQGDIRIWLGGNDAIKGGEWHWNNGSSIPLPDATSRNGWIDGINPQPSGTFGIGLSAVEQDCLYMKTQTPRECLGDGDCEQSYPFICEKRLITLINQPIDPKFYELSRRGRPARVGLPAGSGPQANRGFSAIRRPQAMLPTRRGPPTRRWGY